MIRVGVALAGLIVFATLFAAAYDRPPEVTEELPAPRFRLAPGEAASDFIEPAAQGEQVQVNITVLSGGPIAVYLMNMENLTLKALNGSTYTFDVGENVSYDRSLSRENVTRHYNFTFRADGENRTALLVASQHPGNGTGDASEGSEEQPQEADVTEVGIRMRYTRAETRALWTGYLLSAPSVLLVGYVVYHRILRAGRRLR